MDELKAGAIAHIRPQAHDNSEDNLVFLCLDHHAEFDRGLIGADEVKRARTKLYQTIEAPIGHIKPETKEPWRRYQEHVQDVLVEELKKSGGDNLNVYLNRIMPGLSGRSREIDIFAELSLAGFRILIAADVKYAKRKINIPDLEAFATKIQDIGANKAIFITNIGFSEPALSFAKKHGIALVQLKEDSKEIGEHISADSSVND